MLMIKSRKWLSQQANSRENKEKHNKNVYICMHACMYWPSMSAMLHVLIILGGSLFRHLDTFHNKIMFYFVRHRQVFYLAMVRWYHMIVSHLFTFFYCICNQYSQHLLNNRTIDDNEVFYISMNVLFCNQHGKC